MSKFPEDLRVYEHLMWVSQANIVVELGAYRGGSALWFRDRLATMSHYGRIGRRFKVISVDIDVAASVRNVVMVDPKTTDIEFIQGDVQDESVVGAVAQHVTDDDRCIVVEDSAHVYETTTAALNLYSRFVPQDGFFIVEDGCVDIEEMRLRPHWPRGVIPAISDFLVSSQGAAFAQRRDLELYGLTCHPDGYLQRIST